jgi:Alcohol dehydrogenase GroES-like domain
MLTSLGLCGSDLHGTPPRFRSETRTLIFALLCFFLSPQWLIWWQKVYRGHEKRARTGYVIGHEYTGVILAVGSGVKKFKPGDHVISPFTRYDRTQLSRLMRVARAENVSIV